MNNFQDEFDSEAPCPETIMPLNPEFQAYRNVALDYQPEDTVFKGACARAPTMVAEYYPSSQELEDDGRFYMLPDQKGSSDLGEKLKMDLDLISCFDLSSSPVYVPQPPIVVLSTSFKCCKTADDIVSSVKKVFESLGVSFEFSPSVAEFNAVFVKGNSFSYAVYIVTLSDI